MTKRTDGPSAEVRIRVMKRDRFTCTYCGVLGPDAELEIDHIVPVARGGSHHISNLTTACRACNQAKGTKVQRPNAPIALAAEGASESAHPLVGMFFHTFEQGEIQYQAHVLGVDGDTVLARMFSWMTGAPTDVRAFPKALLYSGDCKLYPDIDSWRDAADRHEARAARVH